MTTEEPSVDNVEPLEEFYAVLEPLTTSCRMKRDVPDYDLNSRKFIELDSKELIIDVAEDLNGNNCKGYQSFTATDPFNDQEFNSKHFQDEDFHQFTYITNDDMKMEEIKQTNVRKMDREEAIEMEDQEQDQEQDQDEDQDEEQEQTSSDHCQSSSSSTLESWLEESGVQGQHWFHRERAQDTNLVDDQDDTPEENDHHLLERNDRETLLGLLDKQQIPSNLSNHFMNLDNCGLTNLK